MKKGTVDWFDTVKGWGFIKTEEKDVFVYFKDIVDSDSRRKNLYSGDEVFFVEERVLRNGKYCPQARNVTLLKSEKKRIMIRG